MKLGQQGHDKHFSRASGGFTIIEILVALAISMVLIAGFIKVIVDVNQGTRLVESLNVSQDGARIAQDILGKGIINAGHWGGINGDDINPAGSLTLVASGGCNAAWITNTAEPIRGYDGGANLAATSFPTGCITNYQAATDILVLRYADPEVMVPSASVTATANANTLFVRTILADSSLGNVGEIFKGGSGITTLLATGDPLGSYNYAYRSDIYYIRACSVTSPSCDNVPTLVRMRYDGTGYQSEILVEQVEQMQLAFGSDTDGDMTADRYDAAANVPNWTRVNSVRLDLVVRNTTGTAEFSDTATYTLAGGFSYDVATADEKYRRQVFPSTIQIRNINRI